MYVGSREHFSVYANVRHEVFDWRYVSRISGHITWRFKEEKEEEETEKEKWKTIPLCLVQRRMYGRQTKKERATGEPTGKPKRYLSKFTHFVSNGKPKKIL